MVLVGASTTASPAIVVVAVVVVVRVVVAFLLGSDRVPVVVVGVVDIIAVVALVVSPTLVMMVPVTTRSCAPWVVLTTARGPVVRALTLGAAAFLLSFSAASTGAAVTTRRR